jgi:phage antirepressor YoqD-like protein
MENLVIKGVKCRLNENGVVELNLEHVARGLGFTQIAKSGNEVVRWETVRSYLQGFGVIPTCWDDFPQQVGESGLPDFIPENIFYKLCFKAKNEIAKSFQDLVTDEILPSIRKHGAYMTQGVLENIISNPDFGIQLLTSLKEEQMKRAVAERQKYELERQNATLAPKATFYDTVLEPANECIDMGQAAKILKLSYGRNTLFKVLREKGIFFKNKNEPKQEYIERGYFKLFEKPITRNNHPPFIVITVLATQKGLLFLSKLLGVTIEAKVLTAIQ